MSSKLLSNPGKTPQHLHFQKRSWGCFLSTPPFSELGHCSVLWEHTPPSCFSPHSPLFLLMPVKFTSCCTCRFCSRKGEISPAIPTGFCPVCWDRVGAPELCPWGHIWACSLGSSVGLCPELEGNFRKVRNELLNFTGKKSSLTAPVWFPRWALAVLVLCWQVPTHCSGIQENIKCPCWRACPQPTFPPGSVQRPAGA